MQNNTIINKAIFGFKDNETGEKLRLFYKKHTGKDVNFNKINHYNNGFKLLLFSIPFGSITQIGIAAAGYTSKDVKKFSSLDEFINWYENLYK